MVTRLEMVPLCKIQQRFKRSAKVLIAEHSSENTARGKVTEARQMPAVARKVNRKIWGELTGGFVSVSLFNTNRKIGTPY
jgi:hypothetical protein